MKRISSFFLVLLGISIDFAVTFSFTIVLVPVTCFTRLGQVLDLVFNLSDVVSNNVQFVGLDGHVFSDSLDLLFRGRYLLRKFYQLLVIFLLLLPDFCDFGQQSRAVQILIILAVILSILVILRVVVILTVEIIFV